MSFRCTWSAFHDWRAVNGNIPVIARPFMSSVPLRSQSARVHRTARDAWRLTRARSTVESRRRTRLSADRHRVVRALRGNPLDAVDHLLRGERGPRWKLPRHLLSGGEHLHVSAADIHDEHAHAVPSARLGQVGALGGDDVHELAPGVDDRPGAFVLELAGE